MYGIDISNNNASVDWSGVEFVFIKATEGLSFIDLTYHTFRDEAKSRGILWAPYHFAHPDQHPAIDEANYFLSHSDNSPIPCALDFETRPGYNPLAIMGTTAAVQWINDFCSHIAKFRLPPYLYTFRSYADSLYPRLPQWPKWLANGKGVPFYHEYPTGCPITIEQYSSEGGLDRNTSYLPLTPPSTGDDDMPAHLVLLDDGQVIAFPSSGASPYLVVNPSVLNIGIALGFFDKDPRTGPPSDDAESAAIREAVVYDHGTPGSGTSAPTHFQGTVDLNAV